MVVKIYDTREYRANRNLSFQIPKGNTTIERSSSKRLEQNQIYFHVEYRSKV